MLVSLDEKGTVRDRVTLTLLNARMIHINNKTPDVILYIMSSWHYNKTSQDSDDKPTEVKTLSPSTKTKQNKQQNSHKKKREKKRGKNP